MIGRAPVLIEHRGDTEDGGQHRTRCRRCGFCEFLADEVAEVDGGGVVSRSGVAEAAKVAVASGQSQNWSSRCSTAVVRVLDTSVGLAYLPDREEIARRRSAGLGSITRMDVLDVLTGLPAGMPVAVDGLTDRERRRLRQAPDGLVEMGPTVCTRLAVPPVSAQFVVVASRTWREGLRTAGQFAPYCARAMLLRSVPDDLDDARMQAAYFGIGICVFDSDGLQMLVDPEPYVRKRHSCGQWWFAEELYRQIIASGSAD